MLAILIAGAVPAGAVGSKPILGYEVAGVFAGSSQQLYWLEGRVTLPGLIDGLTAKVAGNCYVDPAQCQIVGLELEYEHQLNDDLALRVEGIVFPDARGVARAGLKTGLLEVGAFERRAAQPFYPNGTYARVSYHPTDNWNISGELSVGVLNREFLDYGSPPTQWELRLSAEADLSHNGFLRAEFGADPTYLAVTGWVEARLGVRF